MRKDLVVALGNVPSAERIHLTNDLGEQIDFLDRGLPAGEHVIRMISGFGTARSSILIALTNRRLLLVAEGLDVAGYTLTDVDRFVIFGPERSFLVRLILPPAKHHTLFVSDRSRRHAITVSAQGSEGFEDAFRRARSAALMNAG